MSTTQPSEPPLQYELDPPRIDYTGRRVGRLTAVKFLGWQRVDYSWIPRLPMWECRCDCGRIITRRGHVFKHSRTTLSCGCYRAEVSKAICLSRSKPPGESFKNHIISRVRSGAKKRNIPFTLTRDEAVSVMRQDCYYCGKEPVLLRKARHQAINRHGFPTNTIDRVDNSLGYTIGNVVSACFTCNIMKQNMSTAEFLEHIKRILKHQGGV